MKRRPFAGGRDTMPFRRGRGRTTLALRGALATAVLLLAIPLWLPTPAPTHHPRAPAASPSAPDGSPSGAGSADRPAGTIVGPYAGRLLNTSVTPLGGVATSNRVAVDPTTGTAYSLNAESSNLVGFNLSTGAALRELQVTNPSYATPNDIALDPVHDALFISVPVGPHGFILVYDATTFSLRANITSFPGDVRFEPSYLAYDAPSGQVFAENFSSPAVAPIDTTNDTARPVVLPVCAPCTPQGFIDVPLHHRLLLPTSSSSVLAVNTSSDQLATGLTAPFTSFQSGPGAYDSLADLVWVTNISGAGGIVVFNGSGAYRLTVAGPAFPDAAAFVRAGDMIAVADYNSSAPGAGQEVYCYFSLVATRTQIYHNPGVSRASPGFYFGELVPYVAAGASYLLTAGFENATVAFAVNTTLDTIAPARAFASFVYDRWQLFTDAEHGRYYTWDFAPYGVTGFDAASGSLLWRINLASYGYVPDVAIDPVQGFVYVVQSTAPAVDVYSSMTGGFVSTIFFPNAVTLLAVDGRSHLLYASDGYYGGYNITVVNTTANSNTILSTITGHYYTCALAAVEPTTQVVDASCAATTPTTVTLFSGRTHNAGPSFLAGPNVPKVTVDPSGLVYVPSENGQNLTVFDAVAGRKVGTWLFTGFNLLGVAVDPADQLAVLTSRTQPWVDVVSLATGTAVGTIATPTPSGGFPGFDAATGTFFAPLYFSGQVWSASIVPLPLAPTTLLVTPGNSTLQLLWSAGVATPGYPITGYDVYTASNVAGPWSHITTTPTLGWLLTGLRDGQTYYASIDAVSDAGRSPMTPVVAGVPVGVPYPPQAVNVQSSAPTSLAVTWTPPASTDGSPIVNYTVEYSTYPLGPWRSFSAGPATASTLRGLNGSTTYYVQIVAWNAVGPSNPSAVITATTGPAPANLGGPSRSGVDWSLVLLGAAIGAALVAVGVGLFVWRRRGRPRSLRSEAPDTATSPPDSPPPPR